LQLKMVYWVRSDPCGLFSANLTVGLILYAQFVIVKILLLPWYGFCGHVIMYTLISILALVSHTRAQFSDPGAVPQTHTSLNYPDNIMEMTIINQQNNTNTPQQTQSAKKCRKCNTVKPYKAHHCSICARCIIRMDHHCPWVNNCVAVFNQKYFVLFLFYTCVNCCYSVVLLVSRFISCTNNLRQCSISGLETALCVVNFVEALIFGLFVGIMMFDQISAIFDNTPGIDALQNKHGQKRSKYSSLKDVFGEPFSWRWFIPFNLPPKIREDFGYELQQDEVITTTTTTAQSNKEPHKQV